MAKESFYTASTTSRSSKHQVLIQQRPLRHLWISPLTTKYCRQSRTSGRASWLLAMASSRIHSWNLTTVKGWTTMMMTMAMKGINTRCSMVFGVVGRPRWLICKAAVSPVSRISCTYNVTESSCFLVILLIVYTCSLAIIHLWRVSATLRPPNHLSSNFQTNWFRTRDNLKYRVFTSHSSSHRVFLKALTS